MTYESICKRRRLKYTERLQIEKMLKQKKSIAVIANDLGFARSTIYREIKRAGLKQENYRADIAQIGTSAKEVNSDN